MVETWYELGKRYGITLAVLADIHARRVEETLSLVEQNKPDIILIPGDLVDGAAIEKCKEHSYFIEEAITNLNRIAQIAPTYYSLGNHEKQLTEAEIKELHGTKAVVVDNR